MLKRSGLLKGGCHGEVGGPLHAGTPPLLTTPPPFFFFFFFFWLGGGVGGGTDM